MQFIINVSVLVLLWIANLFNGTGLDSVYHVTLWTQRLTILLFLASIGCKHQMPVERKDFFIFGSMIVIFLASPAINGNGLRAGINYLWVFCLVYLLSNLIIDEKTMLWIGLIYGFLGFAILFIFDYGSTLSGWNTNSIAMIGMHSYLIMLVPFFKTQQIRNKVILISTLILFSVLVFPTDSRSSILFGILAALFAIGIIPEKTISKNNFTVFLWLMIPLIIAFFVINISKGSHMTALNLWSYQRFSKPLFNGRDELWIQGFDKLKTSPIIGIGNFNAANWHNSAITCLVATGIAGFAFWVASFGQILNKVRYYLDDYLVTGCFISFIILYTQQSVELGFISGNPTLLGYILLGLMLGRVRCIEREGLCYDSEN